MNLWGRTIAFIRAIGQRARKRPAVRIVLHCMQAPNRSTMAEELGNHWAHDGSASSHFGVDSNSTVMYVHPNLVAWHVKDDNEVTIGIEQAGYAEWTIEQWLEPTNKRMLDEQTAPLVAWLSVQYGIPLRFVDAAGVNVNLPGVTTHAEESKSNRSSSTHWDPGPNYPLEYVLSKARRIVTKHGGKPPKPPRVRSAREVLIALAQVIKEIKKRPVKLGERGTDRVKLVQQLLRNKHILVTVDGVFGPQTDLAVKVFQGRVRLKQDGIVGAQTITALTK